MQTLLNKPITFGDPEQIAYLQKEVARKELEDKLSKEDGKLVKFKEIIVAECPHCGNYSDDAGWSEESALSEIADRSFDSNFYICRGCKKRINRY